MSAASVAEIDSWLDSGLSHEEWREPTPDQVATLVSKLDQRRHTVLTVSGPDHWYLAVGGGAGAYVVYVENQLTGERFDLINRTSEADHRQIVAGGQPGMYPPDLVVGLHAATRAARAFAENGRPAPELEWNREMSA